MASISRPHIVIFIVSALMVLLYIRFPATPRHLTMHSTNKTAPLHLCDLPAEDLVPDSYVVYLWPGTTLTQHKAALPDVDLDRAIEHVMGPILKDGGILYRATLDGRALHAVRWDGEHVQLVECNRWARLIDDL